jgi:hypothetical protein
MLITTSISSSSEKFGGRLNNPLNSNSLLGFKFPIVQFPIFLSSSSINSDLSSVAHTVLAERNFGK